MATTKAMRKLMKLEALNRMDNLKIEKEVEKRERHCLDARENYRLLKHLEVMHPEYSQKNWTRGQIAEDCVKVMKFKITESNIANAYDVIGIAVPRTKTVNKKLDHRVALPLIIKHMQDLYKKLGEPFPTELEELL